jgi:hypothetical protein
MDETFTTLNLIANKATLKESDVIALLDPDEMVFYHAIRSELDLLQKKPSQQTLDIILQFSKSLS